MSTNTLTIIFKSFYKKVKKLLIKDDSSRQKTQISCRGTRLGTIITIHSSTLKKSFNVPMSVLDRPVSVGPGPVKAKVAEKSSATYNGYTDYFDSYHEAPVYNVPDEEYVDVHIPSVYLSYPVTFKIGYDEKGCFINEVRCRNGLREKPYGERKRTISINEGTKVYIGNEILTFHLNNLTNSNTTEPEAPAEVDVFRRLE